MSKIPLHAELVTFRKTILFAFYSFICYDGFMKSFRFLFFICMMILATLLTFFFLDSIPKAVPHPIGTPKPLLSLYGKKMAFQDKERTLKISPLKLNDIKTLFTNKETSATIIWGGHSFLLQPNSGLEFNSSINSLNLVEGTILWRRILKKPTKISLSSSDQILTLSDAGEVVIDKSSIEVTTYYSQADYLFESTHQTIGPLSRALIKNKSTINIMPILPQVSEIQPLLETVTLKDPKDALIHFSWKTIPETDEYRVRVFASVGLCPLLLERIISNDRYVIDLLRYESDHFFWDVTPYDNNTKSFGVPSQIGEIFRTGRLIKETSALQAPALEIYALTISGSMVLIEGYAQTDSELFINDILVKKDDEGKFIHTLNYSKMGLKNIIFRLISPAEIETRLEKTVNIYVE